MWENRHESIAAEYTKRASKCAWLKLLKKLKVFDANKLVQQLREAIGVREACCCQFVDSRDTYMPFK